MGDHRVCMILKNKSLRRLSRSSDVASSVGQASNKMILSLADHKRAVSLFQLLVTIDKRVNGSGSKQSKRAPTPSCAKATEGRQGREVGSLKKRAYLILVALSMFVAALLLVQLQHNEQYYNDAIKHGPIYGMYLGHLL